MNWMILHLLNIHLSNRSAQEKAELKENPVSSIENELIIISSRGYNGIEQRTYSSFDSP
jgi:hypothetical protein